MHTLPVELNAVLLFRVGCRPRNCCVVFVVGVILVGR